MSTILFNDIIFGPVQSRRLGCSLGVNLLPPDGKVCSFNCIYCECGYNEDFRTKTKLPSRSDVAKALEHKFTEMQQNGQKPDVVTFAGNGEPTMHPDFAAIIDDTLTLRDRYFPQAKVSVLSNATNIDKPAIVEALNKIDNNILKLDSANIDTVRFLDQPVSKNYSIERQVELFKQFDGNFILQTMFVRGSHNGIAFDNTVESELQAWLSVIVATRPREVMIYTIDRETPEKMLEKVSLEHLQAIGQRVEALGLGTTINIAG